MANDVAPTTVIHREAAPAFELVPGKPGAVLAVGDAATPALLDAAPELLEAAEAVLYHVDEVLGDAALERVLEDYTGEWDVWAGERETAAEDLRDSLRDIGRGDRAFELIAELEAAAAEVEDLVSYVPAEDTGTRGAIGRAAATVRALQQRLEALLELVHDAEEAAARHARRLHDDRPDSPAAEDAQRHWSIDALGYAAARARGRLL